MLKSHGFNLELIKNCCGDILLFFRDFVLATVDNITSLPNGGFSVKPKPINRPKDYKMTVKGSKEYNLASGIYKVILNSFKNDILGIVLKEDAYVYLDDRKYAPLAFGLLYEPEYFSPLSGMRPITSDVLFLINAKDVMFMKSFERFKNKTVESKFVGYYLPRSSSCTISVGAPTSGVTDFVLRDSGLISSMNWGIYLE